MSKAMVTKLFIGAGLAMIAGIVLAFIGVGIGLANDVFVMNGSDIVGLRGGAVAWSSLGLGLVGIARAGRRSDRGLRSPGSEPC